MKKLLLTSITVIAMTVPTLAKNKPLLPSDPAQRMMDELKQEIRDQNKKIEAHHNEVNGRIEKVSSSSRSLYKRIIESLTDVSICDTNNTVYIDFEESMVKAEDLGHEVMNYGTTWDQLTGKSFLEDSVGLRNIIRRYK